MHTLKTSAHHPLTDRHDAWFVSPVIMAIAGVVAVGYLFWAAIQGEHYTSGPYLSYIYATPFIPSWWHISPAFILIWIPIGFRLTCYYARQAYYRAGFGDPIACGLDEPYRGAYHGETRLPFFLNNLHRYFLYFAIMLLILHWFHLMHATVRSGEIYLGIGTLFMAVDTIALTFYVGGCHSLRYILGGSKRMISCGRCGKIRHSAWRLSSFFNQFHDKWFWISLYSVIFADLYIRLLSMGVIERDFHIVF